MRIERVLVGLIMALILCSYLVVMPSKSSHYVGENTSYESSAGIKKGVRYTIKAIFDRSELGDDYPYDIDTIKNMSLADLNWTIRDLDGDGQAMWYINYTNESGVEKSITVIEGSFGGKDSLGGDTYTMVPREYLMQGNVSVTKTIHLLHGAILLLPHNYPNCSGLGYGIFINTHDVPSLKDIEIKMIATILVDRYEVPVLLAGEFSQNWLSFNFTEGQDAILYPSVVASMLRYEFSDLPLKMVYMYPLLRMNLMANTLFCRLVENYGGNLDKGIITEGASKQGFVRWFVGMLDDRVKVMLCDLMQLQDLFNATKRYYTDWGLPPIQNSSQGDWANYSNQISTILINLGEAYQCGYYYDDCPYRLLYDVWDISRNIHLLGKDKFIVINGEIGGGYYKNGKYKLQHDGRYFPLGSETTFLHKLNELGIDWRYGRDQTKHGLDMDDVPLNETRILCNLLAGLHLAVAENMNFSSWQKVKKVEVSITPINETHNLLNVTAVVSNSSNETRVMFWYAANSDRRWNDPEHTSGIFKWRYVTMNRIAKDRYVCSVAISKHFMYGYYVEAASYCTELPIIGKFNKFDASPVEFIQEYPPAANGSSNLYISSVDVVNYTSSEIDLKVTLKADRIKIWYLNYYPSPLLTNILVRVIIDGGTSLDYVISIGHEKEIYIRHIPKVKDVLSVRVIVDLKNILAESNETDNDVTFVIPIGEVSETGLFWTIMLGIAAVTLIERKNLIYR